MQEKEAESRKHSKGNRGGKQVHAKSLVQRHRKSKTFSAEEVAREKVEVR